MSDLKAFLRDLKAFLRGVGFALLCMAFGYFILGELLR